MRSRWQVTEPLAVADRRPGSAMSRAEVLKLGAAAAGAVSVFGLLDARSALAWGGADPRPIPGGFDENFNIVPHNPFIHILPPSLGLEMSPITDFSGVIAAGEIQGRA